MTFMGPPQETFQGWANASPIVFEASAESVVAVPRQTADGYREGSRTTVLQIFKVWKGALASKVVLESSSLFDCAFGFEQGHQYLVFAEVREGKLFVRHCSGTIPLEEAGDYLLYYQNSTGAVCGTVRNPEGAPAADAFVAVWRPAAKKNQFTTYRTAVGADGSYRLGLLKPGKYPLIAFAVTERPYRHEVGFYGKNAPRIYGDWTVEVEAGKEVCGFDMNLVRLPLWTVRGRIQTEDGSPAPKECTAFLRDVATGHPMSYSRYVGAGQDGRFEFEGVPYGPIYAYATCHGKNEDGTVWRGVSKWVIKDIELVLTVRRFRPEPQIKRE